MLVGDPEFIGGNSAPILYNTEQRFFCIVQALDMNFLEKVVRESFHEIKNDPENDKDGEACDKFPGEAGAKIHGIKEQHQVHLVCFKTNQEIRQQQVHQRDNSYHQKLAGVIKRIRIFLCNIQGIRV